MKIIDSHVHIAAHASDDEWRILTGAARKSGIGRLIVSHVFCGSNYPSEAELKAGNAFCFEQARKSNGQLAALVYLNPQLDSWAEQLQEGIRHHAVGVKLWVSLKDETGSMRNTLAVLKRCGELHLPVLIHVFNRTGKRSQGEINMAEFMELAGQCPETVMIAAHSGGNVHDSAGFFRSAPKNVYFDICGTAPENGMLARLLKETDASRILYGSDGMGRSYHSQLLKIFSCQLSKEEQERILWKNAAEIYHLEEPEDLPCPSVNLHAAERDFCVFCGRWSFADYPANTPAELDALLLKEQVKEAYTASLDSIFTLDLLDSNLKFGQSCRNLKQIRPLGVCNPIAVNAANVLTSAIDSGLFAGIWFSPYIHSYSPADERFLGCLKQCAEKQIPVFLNFGVSEYRFRPLFFAPRETAAEELKQLYSILPPNLYTIQGTAVLPESLPEGVKMNFCCSRIADHANTQDEFPPLPPGAVWVQSSEYPFRPLCFLTVKKNL